jgi:hypothetical protein
MDNGESMYAMTHTDEEADDNDNDDDTGDALS